MSGLEGHLASGVTTLCRAWALRRADGLERGFTDHDRALSFEGIAFRPETGMSASALVQGAGLAADTGEALGAISDAGITEAEIAEGRLDGAELRLWRVNWAAPEQRVLEFRGRLGEIRRDGTLFRAELRGLSDLLNQPLGRVYQPRCDACLGDARCGVDLGQAGASVTRSLGAAEGARLRLDWPDGPAAGWFGHGRVEVLDGPGAGLAAEIREDRVDGGARILELWRPIGVALAPGTALRLVAGCDKRGETCRLKFDNFLNFRGFPHLPGADWLMAVPRAGGA
ncbi:putative phage protein (TIGR02218 family) [Limimaricola soesokkakensis]|uniref:Putative phage protein (TIGR02218 family) n=1 Tax=Limimaricola soesokkakensis TaxID=1343159 RepID=A0A1X6ZVE5_9RHOB|nr:DUF2163 domain-containing protein [Limimaricola soesokkakensis]PSK83007.1 putative phage protein (TIGR02218 family) [Limimaricola soesokkakensis]SLN62166.1 hypothetical protein LOS8367_03022 [Limimaricola soesokkakensis]